MANTILEIGKGTKLTYLGEKSDRKVPLTLLGIKYADYFYKVRAENGQEGWIHGAGLKNHK